VSERVEGDGDRETVLEFADKLEDEERVEAEVGPDDEGQAHAAGHEAEQEAGEAAPAMRAAGLDWIPLAAPTSGMARVREFDRAGSGFLYLISVTGVTGARESLPPGTAAWTREVRRVAKLPVAVGFGISSPRMAREATRHADAAVVGSACVKIVERRGGGGRGPAELSRFVRSLKTALR